MPSRKAPKLGGGSVTLDAAVFEARFNMPLVHETVRAELNARRRGTASTLSRGQVAGGGAKPWRQKGTGRARAGSNRSPLWAGGGVAFGPTPRGYTLKVNRKERRAALRGALSMHAERGSLAVFDASSFAEPSAKQAASLLEDWGAAQRVLVLLGETEDAAGKSFRNLARVEAMPVADAGVADVVGAASLLVSGIALPQLVARATNRTKADAPPTPSDATPTPADAPPTTPADAPPTPPADAPPTTPADAPDSGAASTAEEAAA